MDDRRVTAEWMRRGDAVVFERSSGSDGEVMIRWGDGLDVDDERATFLRFVADGTRCNQPLLAELCERNVGEVEGVTDYFSRGVEFEDLTSMSCLLRSRR